MSANTLKSKVLPLLIGVGASGLGLYFATKNVHWSELKGILASATLTPLVFAGAMSSITFMLRGLRWKILLSPFQSVPLFTLVRWQIGGVFINNILPFRAGELVRAFWAGHKAGIPKSTVFATIVMERLCDLGSIAIIGALVATALGFGNFFSPRNLAIGGAVLVAAIAAFKIFSGRINSQQFFAFLRKHLPEKLCHFIEKFSSGLKVVQSKREVAKLMALSFVIWPLDIAAVLFVSQCLDLHLTWLKSAMVMVGLILGVMVPAAPGAAGTFEAGGVAALSLFGIGKTLAFSFVLLLHAFQYVFVMALGIPILMSEGFHLKTLKEAEKEAASEA